MTPVCSGAEHHADVGLQGLQEVTLSVKQFYTACGFESGSFKTPKKTGSDLFFFSFFHVTWPTTRSITQSDSDQCHTPTLTRVSPTNFDTVLFFGF